jgi:uncharacterized protein
MISKAFNLLQRKCYRVFFFLAVLLSASSHAQQLYFPRSHYSDSASLSKSMPVLAKQVIARYSSADKGDYLDNILRYQNVAQEYLKAKANLDSLRELYKSANWDGTAAIGIQFETFMLAREAQKKDNRPFEVIFRETLEMLYNKLPAKATPWVGSFFEGSGLAYKKSLNELLAKVSATSKDSISFEDARALCRTYNSYIVFIKAGNIGKAFLEEQELKKFNIEDSVLITTPKGVRLTAVVVRKKEALQPLPVILVYNIYAGAVDKTIAKDAASKDFVGIVVNTRGKNLSPENIEPFEHDAEDAYYIIDWISKQPWCNGSIGMYGGSYLGFSQWSATKKLHPALKTIVPQVAVGIGIDYPMHNNVFMTYMLRWIHYVVNNKFTDRASFSDSKKWQDIFEKWYVSGKSFRSIDSIEGNANPIFQRWLDHPSHDSYWQSMVPYRDDFGNINIPVLTTTGYFDDDQRGALYYYEQHHRYNKNANHYLLIGPYDHAGGQGRAQSSVRGYTIDSVANLNVNETVFEWFNHILKNGPKPGMLKNKINYQAMGTNQWKHVSSLKEMNNDTLTFYFTPGREKSINLLDQRKPEKKNFITQQVDLADRSDVKKFVDPEEVMLLDTALNIHNKVMFASAPLEHTVLINGSFIADLKFILNKKDVDLQIELYEQQPDGKYFALSSYLGRASYTKDRSKRQLLTPGKEENLLISNTYFTSKLIAKGSRIVVLIGPVKNPYWQINYGTGKDVSDETIKDARTPLQIKWSTASAIKLPVHKP